MRKWKIWGMGVVCAARGAVALATCAGLAVSVLAEDRSFDGSGNNLSAMPWGSAGQQMIRFGASAFGDGFASMGGGSRPNPREISNTIVAQSGSMPEAGGATHWVWQWGQFIDHDIDITPVGSEFEPIIVPGGDAHFTPGTMIPFTRSEPMPGTGGGMGNPREHINGITAWVDASNVYGSSQSHADALRSFSGGQLAFDMHATGALLPKDMNGQFMAGDERAGEQVGLTATHTLFMRQHNAWADALSTAGFSGDDETLYQAARKIVGAQMQIITYNEWLPELVGPGAISPYSGYDDSVNPNVANEFATALFRIGHSMLPTALPRIGNDGATIPEGSISLADSFFNPGAIENEGGISPLLKGLGSDVMQTVDIHLVDDVRNFLFEGGNGGFDLASLNIQRGRDHGLADYNATRVAYGLAPVASFNEITSDPGLAADLQALYGTVDDIDLWIGGLSEDHAAGALVGELVVASIVDQFERLRDGDRFWYEIDSELPSILASLNMTVEDLEAIKLSDIIEGVGGVSGVQENVFQIPTPGPLAIIAVSGMMLARRRRA